MDAAELIALAAVRSKKTLKELAAELAHSDQTRLSAISSGRLAPRPHEIIALAREAALPELDTLAELEAQTNPKAAEIWQQLQADLKSRLSVQIPTQYRQLAGIFLPLRLRNNPTHNNERDVVPPSDAGLRLPAMHRRQHLAFLRRSNCLRPTKASATSISCSLAS